MQKRISGIYCIEHVDSKRAYIGSSRSVYARWRSHQKLLTAGTHHSPYLQRAWQKYGPDSFNFQLIENCEAADLISREQFHIDRLVPVFNVCPKAGSRAGSKQRPEVRQLLASQIKARQGAKTHCPHGHEYTESNTCRSPRGERRCKQCNADRGAKRLAGETPEQREHRVLVMKRCYERQGRSKKWSAEHRRKISESQRGRDNTPAILRSAEVRRAKTHCRNCHEYAVVGVREYNGMRACKACSVEAKQRYRARQQAA